MRIRALDLIAFGPFTETRLEFSEHPGLDVLYGPNEAGKSSALRALAALLFGIPVRTSDNFLHEHKDLRLGGCLVHTNGSELSFIRRKGTRNTLLRPDGALPLDESALVSLLGGMNEAIFTSQFGIDHNMLMKGGDDILAGHGDVAESLFSAAIGGSKLRATLLRLDNEADTLFKMRGQNPRVNAACAEYLDADKGMKLATLSAAEWNRLREEQNQISSERETIESRIHERMTELHRLERVKKALPVIAERDRLLHEWEALCDVPALPLEFSERRQATDAALRSLEGQRNRFHTEREDLQKRIKAIGDRQAFIKHAADIEELVGRLGSHRKAFADYQVLRVEHGQLVSDVRALLAMLKPGYPLENAESLRLPEDVRLRVGAKAPEGPVLAQAAESVARAHRANMEQLEQTRLELKGMPPPVDIAPLSQSVEEAMRLGDLDERLLAQSCDLEAARSQLQACTFRLPLITGVPLAISKLPVPSQETIDHYDNIYSDMQNVRRSLVSRIEEVRQEHADNERELEALCIEGEVPTESDLTAMRARRDADWVRVRRIWLNKESALLDSEEPCYLSEEALADAVEREVTEADVMADRLRREASRVARHASLMAKAHALDKQIESLDKEILDTESREQALHAEWFSIWEPCGIKPLTPREMRQWRAEHARLVQLADEASVLERLVKQSEDLLARHRESLASALACLAGRRADAAESFRSLLERAIRYRDEAIDLARSRKDCAGRLERLIQEAESLVPEEEMNRKALEAWRADWADLMALVGLRPDTSPQEADAYIGKLNELFKKLDDSRKLEDRMRGIERDGEAFEKDVRTLAARLLPDSAVDDPAALVTMINSELTKAYEEETRRREWSQRLNELDGLTRNTECELQHHKAEMEELCRIARCEIPEQLVATEKRVAKKDALERDIRVLTSQLLHIGDGLSLDALIEETRSVSTDSLNADIDHLRYELESLGRQRAELERKLGAAEAELDRMDGVSMAAEAAEKKERLKAEIEAGCARYAVLKMASALLRQAMEQYRAEQQGPLLSRASELFGRLTLGSFLRLEADYDEGDRPVLRGVRRSGQKVGPAGMSDGTRDQLYLALRIATLESYLSRNEPMPLVVDDILIRFDDDRSRATLEVLDDLSNRTQVVFFTHHERIVDLARDVVAPGRLRVITLPGPFLHQIAVES